MARKNVLVHDIAVNKSLATSFNSEPTVVRFTDNCSYQIDITTSNSIGTFAIQASNNYQVDEPSNVVTNVGTWVDLDIGGSPVANAANDTILVDMNQLPFNAIRVKYTAVTPGTGTATIRLLTKQLGG